MLPPMLPPVFPPLFGIMFGLALGIIIGLAICPGIAPRMFCCIAGGPAICACAGRQISRAIKSASAVTPAKLP